MDVSRIGSKKEFLDENQPDSATPKSFKDWPKSLKHVSAKMKEYNSMVDSINATWQAIAKAEKSALDRVLSQWGLSCKTAADASEKTLIQILAAVNIVVE